MAEPVVPADSEKPVLMFLVSTDTRERGAALFPHRYMFRPALVLSQPHAQLNSPGRLTANQERARHVWKPVLTWLLCHSLCAVCVYVT